MWPSKRTKSGQNEPKSKRQKVDNGDQKDPHNNERSLTGSTRSKFDMGTAAYRRWRSAQLEVKENCPPNVITVNDSGSSGTAEITTKEQGLVSPADLQILQYTRGTKAWVNGRLVNAGQQLLHAKFSEVKSLQSIDRLDTLSFSATDGEFVQILNCDNQHWVCISTFGCKAGTVKV